MNWEILAQTLLCQPLSLLNMRSWHGGFDEDDDGFPGIYDNLIQL